MEKILNKEFFVGLLIGLSVAMFTYFLSWQQRLSDQGLQLLIEKEAQNIRKGIEDRLEDLDEYKLKAFKASEDAELVLTNAMRIQGEVQLNKETADKVLAAIKDLNNVELISESLEPLITRNVSDIIVSSIGKWKGNPINGSEAGNTNAWTSTICPKDHYMVGLKVIGYDAKYCNTCIYKVQSICRSISE